MRKIKVIISWRIGEIQRDINEWLESKEAQESTVISISSAAFENSAYRDVILTYILYEKNKNLGVTLNS